MPLPLIFESRLKYSWPIDDGTYRNVATRSAGNADLTLRHFFSRTNDLSPICLGQQPEFQDHAARRELLQRHYPGQRLERYVVSSCAAFPPISTELLLSGSTLESPGIVKRNGVRTVPAKTDPVSDRSADFCLSRPVSEILFDRVAHEWVGAEPEQILLRLGASRRRGIWVSKSVANKYARDGSPSLGHGQHRLTSRHPQHEHGTRKTRTTSHWAQTRSIWVTAGGRACWAAAGTSGTRSTFRAATRRSCTPTFGA